jgi:pilus assembly protein CpaE
VSSDSRPAFSIALVEGDTRARNRIARLVRDVLEVDAFVNADALDQRLNGSPCVVIFGPSFGNEAGIEEIHAQVRSHFEVAAILIANELTTELLQQALRSGIRDVLSPPKEPAEVVDAVERVAESLGGALAASALRQDGERGRLITVMSTKGGAGKTVVATNLAVLLAQSTNGRVALVDADLQFGDVALMLGLAPASTVVDVLSVIRRLDAVALQELLLRHEPSGLLVLPAPIEPAFADQITAADLTRIVTVLRSFCEYVVVDTPSWFTDVVLALLDESDDILLVAALELPSIKNAKLALQTLHILNIAVSKVKLVLNRANSKAKLDVKEVERALGLKVDAPIVSDVAVPRAVNQGQVVVLASPRSEAAASLRALSQLFVAAPPRARSRLGGR